LSVYEEEINGFIYREYRPLGKPRFLVTGLPDVGLVGEIATVHMIRNLGLTDSTGVDIQIWQTSPLKAG
jgi:predicted ATP-grasp superfamily ATP-dependent carboligase